MALTVGELVGYMRVDDKQWKRTITMAKGDLKGMGGTIGGVNDDLKGMGGIGSKMLAGIGAAAGLATVGLMKAVAAGSSLGTVMIVLAPTVLLLGGMLGSLFTLITGGIGTMAVFKLGLGGVSDALSEVWETGKLSNETLKKLSPNARALVKELAGFKKPLDDLRKFVQDKLLDGINISIRDLGKRWLPALKPMLGDLASRFNRFGKTIFDALGKPDFINNIKGAMSGFGDFIDRIGQSMGPLIDAFGRLARASVPFLKELGNRIGGLIEKFGAWIKQADESGALTRFMNDAAKALRDIWSIGGLVIGILGDIVEILFPGSKRVSDTFLGGIKAMLQGVKDWLGNPENQKMLQGWIEKIQDFIEMVATEWIPRVLAWVKKVAEWVTTVENWVNKFKEFKDGLIQGWEDLKTKTLEKLEALVQYFIELPERIIRGLISLPGRMLAVFAEMASTALYITGFMIGQVVSFMLTLPGRMADSISDMPGLIGEIFERAKSHASIITSLLVDTVRNLFVTIPGKVWEAIVALPGLIAAVFTAGKNQSTSIMSSLVSSAVSIAAGLPGKIRDAIGHLGGLLVQAGRDLIQGFINGIDQRTGGLISKAIGIANVISSTIRRALNFGSPSRVAMQWGRWIGEGLAIGMDRMAGEVAASAMNLSDAAVGSIAPVAAMPPPLPSGGPNGSTPGSGTVTVRLVVDGADTEMKRMFRNMVRLQGGGNVQTAFGKR